MKKIGIVLMTAILLTGCVQSVELTEQESNKISEYAAYITLKYDKKYDKKLVEAEKLDSAQLSSADEQSAKDEPSKAEAVDNITDELLNSEEEGLDNQEETTSEEEADNKNLAELFSINDFTIEYAGLEYAGLEYAKTYPKETEKYKINAGEGKEFLVLKFNVTNTTEDTKLCELLSISPKFEVSINGADKAKNYVTLLDNDLSTLCNEIAANSSMEAVLIVDIDEGLAESVESIDLSVTLSGKTSDYRLQ